MCLEAGTEQIPYDFEKNHTGFALFKLFLSRSLFVVKFNSEKYFDLKLVILLIVEFHISNLKFLTLQ